VELEARNELVLANLPLVGYLAAELCSKATHLSREDLVSVGTIAMISAAESFDPSRGVPFGAFARRRIMGAFADDMRSNDWATRGARQKITATRNVQEALTGVLGRQPSEHELADAMGVSSADVRAVMADAERSVVALEETMHDSLLSEMGIPEENILHRERISVIHAAVQCLPQKLQILIRRLFFEGATVKQIAAEAGVTHSAISQQRTVALKLLHEAIQTHYLTDRPPVVQPKLTKSAQARRDSYLDEFARQATGGRLDDWTGPPMTADIA